MYHYPISIIVNQILVREHTDNYTYRPVFVGHISYKSESILLSNLILLSDIVFCRFKSLLPCNINKIFHSCMVLYGMLISSVISGFVWFILSLKKRYYKYQFGQYAWTHMILIVVFTQSAFTVANIFEGIFW